MEKRYLGLDFGLSRIGVALSYATLAEPLEVIANNEKTFEYLLSLIKKNGVTDLVVGVSEQEMAQLSTEFGQELAKRSGCELHFQDEALSTVEVQKLLRQKFAGKKQYRGAVDHFAAAHILERYLDDVGSNF